jgi:hypothetical protein
MRCRKVAAICRKEKCVAERSLQFAGSISESGFAIPSVQEGKPDSEMPFPERGKHFPIGFCHSQSAASISQSGFAIPRARQTFPNWEKALRTCRKKKPLGKRIPQTCKMKIQLGNDSSVLPFYRFSKGVIFFAQTQMRLTILLSILEKSYCQFVEQAHFQGLFEKYFSHSNWFS